ncbi:flagellar basal body rod protein FlgC [Oleiagrimonas sp. C23AA]|uniref:flagellar basal body rod protein FlgC n=1 Tax=Oleiagrimonas sp. C23AA TaxID=2719047 RepID=UPI00141F255E|nr:flagellar basal body rod protein FlgC [Oleiagrimonas sp. C23AA]NII09213.1 flagellar basal body rod protein FlgC [Oleiagrimonas sp. C23AA]
MSLFNIFQVAGSGMSAQSVRLNTTASNLANANTVTGSAATAYRAREPLFEAVQQNAMGQATDANGDTTGSAVGVRVAGVTESQQPIDPRFDPNNPLADADGYVYGSNVNTVDELVNMISASRTYQNNAEVMNTAKQLMLKTLDLGK